MTIRNIRVSNFLVMKSQTLPFHEEYMVLEEELRMSVAAGYYYWKTRLELGRNFGYVVGEVHVLAPREILLEKTLEKSSNSLGVWHCIGDQLPEVDQ